MKTYELSELEHIFKNIGYDRKRIEMSETNFNNMDLSNFDLHNTNLARSSFKNANLTAVDFRHSDLTEANIEGANLYFAILEQAKLDGIIHNDATKFFKLRCPAEGAFIGWKRCFNGRMVQLLIPADAKRSSATNEACRCSKAKVLSIKSVDYKQIYNTAYSYAAENFVYRVGEMAIPSGFNEDRWADSTYGLHFFMSRDEALYYLKG